MRVSKGLGGILLAFLVACTAPRKADPCDWKALGIQDPNAPETKEDPKTRSGVPAYTEAARVLVAQGDVEDALRVLDAGLELDPGDVELLLLRSDLLMDTGYGRAAEGDLVRALDRDPSRIELWQRLGTVRLELDLPASACQAFRRCSSLDPRDGRTDVLLAEATRRCGQTSKAWSLYVEALAQPAEVGVEALVDAASLYLDEKVQSRFPDDRTTAYGWLNRALVRDPNNARGHFVRGALLEEEGKLENAVASYERVLEADPSYPSVKGKLAVLLAADGKALAAAALATIALAEDCDAYTKRELLEIVAAAPTAALL